MLRILLVDDELLVRKGIRYGIDWPKYGMEVAAEADSVDAAILTLRAEPIDIVFTDIVMPEKNGLHLLRWIHENMPLLTTVILSYHNDFAYIQEALRLGAADYIIKTELDYEDSSQALSRLEKKARANRQNTDGAGRGGPVGGRCAAVALVSASGDDIAVPDAVRAKAAQTFSVTPDSALLLFSGPPDDRETEHLAQTIGEGAIWCALENTVGASVPDLILAVRVFVNRDLFYVYYPRLRVYSLDVQEILHRQGSLDGPAYTRLEEEFSRMEWVYDSRLYHRLIATIFQARLLPSVVYNLFYNVQQQWRKFFDSSGIPGMYPISAKRFWYQWLDWLGNYQALISTQSRLSSYSAEVVSSVQRLVMWINENYAEEITLPEASRLASLSESYLSRCFKEILGKPFNVYIRDTRLDHAQEFLVQSNLTMSRIAELCGFRDQFYFIKVFKHRFGVSPGLYRQQRHRP